MYAVGSASSFVLKCRFIARMRTYMYILCNVLDITEQLKWVYRIIVKVPVENYVTRKNFVLSLSQCYKFYCFFFFYLVQVEKLKRAFFSIFPFPNGAPRNVVQATAEGYSSYPMRTCRRQQYPHSEPAPPTPPVSVHIRTHTHSSSLTLKLIQLCTYKP